MPSCSVASSGLRCLPTLSCLEAVTVGVHSNRGEVTVNKDDRFRTNYKKKEETCVSTQCVRT